MRNRNPNTSAAREIGPSRFCREATEAPPGPIAPQRPLSTRHFLRLTPVAEPTPITSQCVGDGKGEGTKDLLAPARRAGWGQIPASAAAVPLPRLVIRAMAAPASATAAPTRKALCISGGERGVGDLGDGAGGLGRGVVGHWRYADRDRALDLGQLGGDEGRQVGGVPAGRQQAADLRGHDRAEDGADAGDDPPPIAMETNERRKPVLKERHRILLGSNTRTWL